MAEAKEAEVNEAERDKALMSLKLCDPSTLIEGSPPLFTGTDIGKYCPRQEIVKPWRSAPTYPGQSGQFVSKLSLSLDDPVFQVGSKPVAHEIFVTRRLESQAVVTLFRTPLKMYVKAKFREKFQHNKRETEIPDCVVWSYLTEDTGYGKGRVIYSPTPDAPVDDWPFFIALQFRPLTKDGKNVSVTKGFAHKKDDRGDFAVRYGVCAALLLEKNGTFPVYLFNEKSSDHKELLKQSTIEVWFNKSTESEKLWVNGKEVSVKRPRDKTGDDTTTPPTKRQRPNPGQSSTS